MAYAPLPMVKEDLAWLEEQLRLCRHPERKRRLHLLLLIKAAKVATRKAAAEHLALHRNTVAQWLSRYSEAGLEALLESGTRGKPAGQRTLPASAFQALQEKLATAEGFSGYKAIQQWLYDEFALVVPYKSVHNLVRYRLGAKLKRPRPVHPKKA